MATPERVIIERRGERYAIAPAQFPGYYEDSGFRIVSWEDGSDYDPDAPAPRETKADLIADGLAIGALVDESMTKAAIGAAIEARRKELAGGAT